MLTISIPGAQTLRAGTLVLDYNGTLAVDGVLLDGVGERLCQLAEHMSILVLTADTFGGAAKALAGLPVELRVLDPGAQDIAKRNAVNSLDGGVISIGNGRNDALMLQAADLGVAVMQAEGVCFAALQNADVVCASIVDALDLLLKPDRLRATLRR